ncbi:MAG: DUF302 domain-containing protein [Candidatus Cloacimonetes bacterium]|nr:DUF302 domain-containing protein [Candidatus Cloacimonadota bacterium]
MKKVVLFLVSGFILGIAVTGIITWKTMPGLMLKVVESRYDFEETLSRLQQQIYSNNWEVRHIYEIGEDLYNMGYEGMFLRVNVISFCQPEYTYSILQDHHNRKISAIMPCRIAIFEDNEGNVFLSRMNIGLFSKMFSGDIGKILKLVAADDEKILKDLSKE